MLLSYEYRLKSGQLLDGVEDGSLTFSVAQTVKSSGSISYVDQGTAIDWLNEEIEISAFKDGVEIPLGVFIPTLPDADYTETGRTYKVALLDMLTLLNQDLVPSTYSVESGANIVDTVVALIGDYGRGVTYEADATAVMANAAFFDAGSTKLSIINDLLDRANYFSLWVDGNGFFRITPYTKPASRPLATSFNVGALNQKTNYSEDIYSIPNRFIAIGESDPEEEAPVAVAENHRLDSPYSYENRGRWITKTETSSSALDLQAYAEQRLAELENATVTVTVEHVLEDLQLNDRIFVDGVGSCTLQKMEIKLSLALVKSTLRGISG